MTGPLAFASHLDRLVDLGYGTTRRDVEIYLIVRGLDDLLRAGVIRPASEPDAAVAAGDDVLSAPGQALTAPPVDCTAAAPGTWTPLDLDKIRIEYERGDPPIEIARRHGRSDGRIHQLAKANGWQRHAPLRPTDTPKGGARPNSGPKRHVEEAPRSDPAPFEPLPRAAAAPAPANDRASVLPAPDAKNWPLARRAIVTAGWKAGKSAADIAAEATQHGFRTLPGQVLAAVAQLELTNDPDRRRAMHGGGT